MKTYDLELTSIRMARRVDKPPLKTAGPISVKVLKDEVNRDMDS